MEKRRQNGEKVWSYGKSFSIAGVILLIGFILEGITQGRGMGTIGWPGNIYVLFGFAGALVYIFFFFQKSPLVRWLMSVQAAISAISLFTVVVLMLGFIPQNDQANSTLSMLGLTHVKSSYPLILSQFYFLTSLGMVTLKRLVPFSKKNIGFLLNHFGLWLLIAAAGLGSGDLKRLTLRLDEGKGFENVAMDRRMKLYQLPFQFNLLDFSIEQYNPKLALFDVKERKLVEDEKNLPLISEGSEIELNNWKIKVNTFYPGAFFVDSTYILFDTIGSSPAAYVTAENVLNKQKVSGWLASGSQRVPRKTIFLSNQLALALTQPQPKVYSSNIEVKTEELHDTIRLEVNKPYKIYGYKIYQTGFDETKGKWSTTSILEVVRDPWLPVIYIAIFMLLAGAIYIFWIGKDIK